MSANRTSTIPTLFCLAPSDRKLRVLRRSFGGCSPVFVPSRKHKQIPCISRFGHASGAETAGILGAILGGGGGGHTRPGTWLDYTLNPINPKPSTPLNPKPQTLNPAPPPPPLPPFPPPSPPQISWGFPSDIRVLGSGFGV